MSEILIIDPSEYSDELALDREARQKPSYSEIRQLGTIEGELKREGMSFSFEEQFKLLADRFSDETFEVLDSGCGTGKALEGMMEIASRNNMSINTTGVTLNE